MNALETVYSMSKNAQSRLYGKVNVESGELHNGHKWATATIITGVELERGWSAIPRNNHVWLWAGMVILCPDHGVPHREHLTRLGSVRITPKLVGFTDQSYGANWVRSFETGAPIDPPVPHAGGVLKAFNECFETGAPIDPLIDLIADHLGQTFLDAYQIVLRCLDCELCGGTGVDESLGRHRLGRVPGCQCLTG